ncbi:hypothetical protein Hte_009672 [Hypoxylon texense]
MAQPAQYGSLGPVQQYNQLSFSPIPLPQQHQHQHQLQHQHQHQQHQHQHHPLAQQHLQQQHHHQPHQQLQPTSAGPTAFQQHPQTLPPTSNATTIQPQNGLHANPETAPAPPAIAVPTPPIPTAPSTTVAATNATNATPTPQAQATTGTTTTTTEPQPKRRRVGRPPKTQAVRDYQAQQRAGTGPPLPPPRPPPLEHTPHPLTRGPYATAEDATFALQQHVFTSGYGVSQKRTVKEKLPSGRYDPAGEVIRRDFACDRGGTDFVSQSTGERRRESKKCGCPWKAVARRLKREGDMWFVEVLDPLHNHPVTPPAQMHTIASYRRWQRENNAGIRTAIDRLARAAAMPARQVAAYLKGDYADPELDRIDRHILRALSMSDVELPTDAAADQSTIVFEVIGRRPTIVLQGGNAGAGGANGSNPSG